MHNPASSRNHADIAFVVAVMTVAGALASFAIGRSLWHDEALTAYFVDHDLAGLLAATRDDSSPPLYFLLLAAWTRALGSGEAALRLYSGLCYLATIPVLYWLGLVVTEERSTARLAALLWAFSPFALMQSQNARMYTQVALCGALTLVGFFLLLERGSTSWRAWSLYVLANIAGSFTYYWWIFFALAQLIAWFVVYRSRHDRRFLLAYAAAVLPFALLGLPTLLYQTAHVGTTWVGRAGMTTWPARLLATFLLYYGGGWFAGAVYAVGLALVFAGARHGARAFVIGGARLALTLLISATLVVPLVVSRWKPLYKERFTILALVPLVVLAAVLLARFAPRRLVACAAAVLAVAVAARFVAERRTEDAGSDKVSMTRLVAEASPADVLVYTSLSRLSSEYYLKRLGAGDRFLRWSFPAETERHPGWRDVHAFLDRKAELDIEAAGLVAKLRAVQSERPRRIWFYYGSDLEVSEPLKRGLDAAFTPVATRDFRGSFYDRVLVYGAAR